MENLKTKSGESVPFFITSVLYYICLIYNYILQLKLVAVWVCSNRGHYTVTKPTQKLLNDMLHNNHQLEISTLIEKKKILVHFRGAETRHQNLKKTLQ